MLTGRPAERRVQSRPCFQVQKFRAPPLAHCAASSVTRGLCATSNDATRRFHCGRKLLPDSSCRTGAACSSCPSCPSWRGTNSSRPNCPNFAMWDTHAGHQPPVSLVKLQTAQTCGFRHAEFFLVCHLWRRTNGKHPVCRTNACRSVQLGMRRLPLEIVIREWCARWTAKSKR
jgi:hypothetical protein